MIELLIFIFGAAIGSFLNVVICRLETGEDIVKKRSHCVQCGHVLAWHDLIPIISFLWLRVKCRYCKKPISWQYPLVEMATGILFVAIFWYLGFETWNLFRIFPLCSLLYVICSLIVIFVYDLRHYIIPDAVLFPAIGAALVYRIFDALAINNPSAPPLNLRGGWAGLYPYLFSALGAAAFFLFLVLITRGKGMGRGDVKLAFLMGLVLGWPNILLALFLAFCLGSLAGVGLIIAGKKTMKSQIPFGPFLILGTMAALFFGEALADFVLWTTFL